MISLGLDLISLLSIPLCKLSLRAAFRIHPKYATRIKYLYLKSAPYLLRVPRVQH